MLLCLYYVGDEGSDRIAHCRNMLIVVVKAESGRHPDRRRICGLPCKRIAETSTISSEQCR